MTARSNELFGKAENVAVDDSVLVFCSEAPKERLKGFVLPSIALECPCFHCKEFLRPFENNVAAIVRFEVVGLLQCQNVMENGAVDCCRGHSPLRSWWGCRSAKM